MTASTPTSRAPASASTWSTSPCPSSRRYATPRNLPVPEASGGLATHDVQFDRAGHALITGAGGVAIYDVANPLAPDAAAPRPTRAARATTRRTFGADDGSTLNDLIHHNSHRLPNSVARRRRRATPRSDSDVMVITEEDYYRPTCAGARLAPDLADRAATLIRNLDSLGRRDRPRAHVAVLGPLLRRGRRAARQGWYEQGTRFLDVSNPRDIRQVGFWIPQKNVTWGARLPPGPTGEIVYALDHPRGIDVLRVKRRSAAREVTPPPDTSGAAAPPLCATRPSTTGQSCASRRGPRQAEAARAPEPARPCGAQGALPLRRAQHGQRRGHRREGARAPAAAAQAPARRPAPAGACASVVFNARPDRAGQGQVARA